MSGERFIADAMLGRLARWLRMLGFDTLYDPGADDRAVMRIAREQGRTILTRDSDFRRPGLGPCVFIHSDHVEDQVAQVVRELRLSRPTDRRCPECNGVLAAVEDKRHVIDSVPEYVYHTNDRFQRCMGCTRIYWEGTHFQNFNELVKGLFNDKDNLP